MRVLDEVKQQDVKIQWRMI